MYCITMLVPCYVPCGIHYLLQWHHLSHVLYRPGHKEFPVTTSSPHIGFPISKLVLWAIFRRTCHSLPQQHWLHDVQHTGSIQPHKADINSTTLPKGVIAFAPHDGIGITTNYYPWIIITCKRNYPLHIPNQHNTLYITTQYTCSWYQNPTIPLYHTKIHQLQNNWPYSLLGCITRVS